MAWIVKFFQTDRGEYPVSDFIEDQDEKLRARLIHAVDLLETDGPYLKPPYIKKLQDKLYELRISGKVEVRIFYTIQNNQYYLLNAFKKKGQKTPAKELRTALDRMKKVI